MEIDLKHTTKAELAKHIEELEQENAALKSLAEDQSGLLKGWKKTCNDWRDLFYDCRNHPWRNLYIYLVNGKAEAERDD